MMWRSPRTLARVKQHKAYEIHRVAGMWTFPGECYSPLGCLSQVCDMFGLLPLELMSTFLPKRNHPDPQSRRGGKLYPKSRVKNVMSLVRADGLYRTTTEMAWKPGQYLPMT